MPACGYEFYLLVFDWISHEFAALTSERSELVRYRVEHSKIKFIFTRGHVISSISTLVLKI